MNNYIPNHLKNLNSNKEFIESCKNGTVRQELLELCNDKGRMETKLEFYSLLYTNYSCGYIKFSTMLFVLITIHSVVVLCRFFKNNALKTYLTRNSYKNVLINLFKKAYKPALIFPIVTIIAIITCLIISKNIDGVTSLAAHGIIWKISSTKNIFFFCLVYILKCFIMSLFYINITTIICRKNHNIIIALILSYITFIAIDIIIEVGTSIILTSIVGYSVSNSILGINEFKDSYGLLSALVVPIICFIITSIIIYT